MKQKSKPKAKQSKPSGEGGAPSSGEESDGLTALKAVEEEERRGGAKRGPPSASQLHWHPPTKHIEPGSKTLRWKFQCHYCNKYVLVSFFLIDCSDTALFLDLLEPELSNELLDVTTLMMRNLSQKLETLVLTLTLNIQTNMQAGLVVPRSHQLIPLTMDTPASAKLMEEFLEKGQLNPKLYPTKKGFLKHFATWLIEEDLPFTTGESYGIKKLFKYLDITFQLPSDTTVQNALAKIYIELHGEVVHELLVSPMHN